MCSFTQEDTLSKDQKVTPGSAPAQSPDVLSPQQWFFNLGMALSY